MTMPEEAVRAVVQTRSFLMALLDPSKTPRVPRDIRLQAHRLVKHYPFECEVEAVSGPKSRGVTKVRVARAR